MLIASRVIAVDDDQKHLDGLAKALNQYGVACLQVHFTGDTTDIKPCPHVRVIFADLHLGEGPVSDPLEGFLYNWRFHRGGSQAFRSIFHSALD